MHPERPLDTTDTTEEKKVTDEKPVELVEHPQLTRKQRRSHKATRMIVSTIGVVLLVSGTAIASSYFTAEYVIQQQARTNPLIDASTLTSADMAVAVVGRVSDSVVSIGVETVEVGFFGQRFLTESAGSGVILTADGYILTNNHVIERAESVRITTNDNKVYDARVIDTAPELDLALIKAEEVMDLSPAQLGDSAALKIGQEVYAIGNALGRFPNSVTKGIVSGLGRPITAGSSGLRGNLQQFEDLIQTDAAINQGNSGGPLVNAAGQVIGINTAVAGQAQNIGFSVPINRAAEIIAQTKPATQEP